MRIALTLLLLFCASAAKAADEVKPAQDHYQHFLDLLNDDDWLTGVWSDEVEETMSLYTLFEKTADGYSVKNYYPRYSVTWWTGKVEKHDDKLLTWDYKIVGDKLLLPDEPTNIEVHKDVFLAPPYMYIYSGNRRLVKDVNLLKDLAKQEFITGEKFLKEKLKRESRYKKEIPHYDLIEKSNELQDMGDIQKIEIIASVKKDLDEFYLLQISLAWPAQLGSCGGSGEDGYYWVHFQKQQEDWELIDEWDFTANECREYKVIVLYKKSETRSTLNLNSLEDENEIGLACFEFNPKDISEKPKPCETEQPATAKN